jgi:ribosome-binding factor A
MERINALLRREISDIVAAQIKDPRLTAFITVTRVETAPDLSRTRVFVSLMGEKSKKDDTLRGLRSASRFVHNTLKGRLSLRSTPTVEFRIDDAIERGAEILKLIDDVAPAPEPGEPSLSGDSRES